MIQEYKNIVLSDIHGLISFLDSLFPFLGVKLQLAFHLIFSLVTFGIFQLIMPFLYNKQYSTRLLNDSWSLDDSDENNQIARQKIGIAVN